MEIFYTHKAAKQLENLPLLVQKYHKVESLIVFWMKIVCITID